MKNFVAWLVRWACPELFHKPMKYYLLRKGGEPISEGVWHNLEYPWQLPDVVALPGNIEARIIGPNHAPEPATIRRFVRKYFNDTMAIYEER